MNRATSGLRANRMRHRDDALGLAPAPGAGRDSWSRWRPNADADDQSKGRWPAMLRFVWLLAVAFVLSGILSLASLGGWGGGFGTGTARGLVPELPEDTPDPVPPHDVSPDFGPEPVTVPETVPTLEMPAGPGTPPQPATEPAVARYEAASSHNALVGVRVDTCGLCPSGQKVRFVGNGAGTLTFTEVVAAPGASTVRVSYTNGDTVTRQAQLRVNEGGEMILDFPPTGSWDAIGEVAVTVALEPGENALRFFNDHAWAPDFDGITVLAGDVG